MKPRESSKKKITAFALGFTLLTACSPGSKTETSGEDVATTDNEIDASTVRDEIYPEVQWLTDKYEFELLGSYGITTKVSVMMSERYDVTSPNTQIVAECPVDSLPARSTSYQLYKFRISPQTDRPYDQRFVLGVFNEPDVVFRTFDSVKGIRRAGVCRPKPFANENYSSDESLTFDSCCSVDGEGLFYSLLEKETDAPYGGTNKIALLSADGNLLTKEKKVFNREATFWGSPDELVAVEASLVVLNKPAGNVFLKGSPISFHNS